MADNNLSALVQALPAELYDEIFHLTFTESGSPRTIDKGYKPPFLLQVNQKSRAQYARTYFGNASIFYISKTLLEKWTRSLPKDHINLLSDIRVWDVRAQYLGGIIPSRANTLHLVEDLQSISGAKVMEDLKHVFKSIRGEVLKIKVGSGNPLVRYKSFSEVDSTCYFRLRSAGL